MSGNTQSVFGRLIQEVIDREFPDGPPAPNHSVSRRGKHKLSIAERFQIFHQRNPHVYEVLVGYAYEELAEGKLRLSISRMWERLRAIPIETDDPAYKLNNDYRSRYVRLIEDNEPALKGLFRKRPLRSF